MSEVILTKGLPGSSKTTWALEQVAANPGQMKRVSKDDLRALLDAGKWSRSNEKMVLDVRDAIIREALSRNCHIIVDDCNLSPTHEERIRHLVSEINKLEGRQHRVRIQDFTDVPLEECIKRDLNRERTVGEKVIRDMYNQFVAPKIDPPVYDANLTDAILSDLDGTLATLNGRNPYDASTCDQDGLNDSVARLLKLWWGNDRADNGSEIILVSGRPDTHREPTERFLKKYDIPHNHLYMRGADDRRQDVEVKQDIYENHIKGKYNVVAVFDDRLQVARLWHALGLPLFRVGDPDASF